MWSLSPDAAAVPAPCALNRADDREDSMACRQTLNTSVWKGTNSIRRERPIAAAYDRRGV